MFTGLVEETGAIVWVHGDQNGRQFRVAAEVVLEGMAVGDSIAINGCCQTVTSFDKTSFTIFSVPETLSVTNLAFLRPGDRVNLERALRLDARLGGHLVQGHVEALAEVVQIQAGAQHLDIALRYQSPYLVPKGSVTLDGISLTIHEIQGDLFRVQIIPETIARTNIGDWKLGRKVNLETDFLVKTIDHLLRYRGYERST